MVWREKLVACAIHFSVTLVVAFAAAGFIFLVWYPAPFGEMLGGTRLFLILSGCDIVLGPLLSLVIYNSRKPKRELITDYVVVGAVQLAALIYGMYVVAVARPAFIVFSKDRLEVVSALDIDDADLAEAKEPRFAHRPWSGPELVAAVVENKDKNDALNRALQGKDVSARPKFYEPYESQLDAIKRQVQPIATLLAKFPDSKSVVEAALLDHELTIDEARWLPTQHRKGFWTALLDPQTGQPLAYVPIDPY